MRLFPITARRHREVALERIKRNIPDMNITRDTAGILTRTPPTQDLPCRRPTTPWS